jgi:hypothetical protein
MSPPLERTFRFASRSPWDTIRRMSTRAPGQNIVPGLQDAAGPNASGDDGPPAPRSLPPTISSLPPPTPRADVAPLGADLSAQHGWLADPRMALLRRALSDHCLVTIYSWGIDPTWTTNQIVGHVHSLLEKKADRRDFEALLANCANKADLVELVYRTLVAIPPDVAARLARMRARSG